MIVPVKCNEWKPKEWLDFHIGGKLYFDFSVQDEKGKLEVIQNFLKGG